MWPVCRPTPRWRRSIGFTGHPGVETSCAPKTFQVAGMPVISRRSSTVSATSRKRSPSELGARPATLGTCTTPSTRATRTGPRASAITATSPGWSRPTVVVASGATDGKGGGAPLAEGLGLGAGPDGATVVLGAPGVGCPAVTGVAAAGGRAEWSRTTDAPITLSTRTAASAIHPLTGTRGLVRRTRPTGVVSDADGEGGRRPAAGARSWPPRAGPGAGAPRVGCRGRSSLVHPFAQPVECPGAVGPGTAVGYPQDRGDAGELEVRPEPQVDHGPLSRGSRSTACHRTRRSSEIPPRYRRRHLPNGSGTGRPTVRVDGQVVDDAKSHASSSLTLPARERDGPGEPSPA